MSAAGKKAAPLFHFTCRHGFTAIGSRGTLVPQIEHPTLGCKVTWLTTEASPDREATGLTSRFTSCDRMAYRYIVSDRRDCVPWLTSAERADAPRAAVADLERYGDPEHWWITTAPVTARLG